MVKLALYHTTLFSEVKLSTAVKPAQPRVGGGYQYAKAVDLEIKACRD